MSFIGKEYVYESNEGIEAFLASFGSTLPDELKQFKVKVKTTKNGDKYTVVVTKPEGVKESVFQNGVEFEDEVRGRKSKATVTIDGNTMTSIRKFEKGTFIITSKYTDDKMVATLSIEGLDNKATVTFKAS